MREIKFRAWDKEKRQMVYVLEMRFLFEEELGIWAKGYDDKSINHEIFPENLVLMQFTGLRDRNGKEIYEGDIIQWDAQKYVVTFSGYACGCEIDGYHTGWVLENRHYKAWEHIPLAPENFDDILVIGNIHQHPELLEQKNE